MMLAALLADLRLAGHLERVPGAFTGLSDRPPDTAGTTILMLGTVSGAATQGPRVPWLADGPALESVMVVDIPPGTPRHVFVDSLPIDEDLARSVGTGRASATVGAVEAATGRRVEHLVVVDWGQLEQLSADNGSEQVFEPGSGVGEQQEFLRRVLADTLHVEMLTQPWTLYAALDTVSRRMAVDDGWSVLEMDLLVLAQRDLRSADIEFRGVWPDSPILANGVPAAAAGGHCLHRMVAPGRTSARSSHEGVRKRGDRERGHPGPQ
jgi:hypothetical protein